MSVLKKTPATLVIALAAALWMMSGGALLASAQDSTAGEDSAAEAMLPADEPIPAGSTFVPSGTTSGGEAIPEGSILLTAGAVLSDGTVIAPGTVLMPDGSLVVFSDSGAWAAGETVPADFVFAPVDLPFTGGSQGMLALVGGSLVLVGGAAFVVRQRLSVS